MHSRGDGDQKFTSSDESKNHWPLALAPTFDPSFILYASFLVLLQVTRAVKSDCTAVSLTLNDQVSLLH